MLLNQAAFTLESAAQNSLALKQVWHTIDRDSCPRKYNFHLHTVCSDGQLTAKGLMEQVVEIGLLGMAITDHHSVKGYEAARRWLDNYSLRYSRKLPHLWTGIEVTAQLLETAVHILGYAFEPEHPAMKPYIQGAEPRGRDGLGKNAIAAIHEAGGLAVLAHPKRYRRSAKQLIPAAAALGIDGVEVYYAYNNPKPWIPSPVQTEEVKQLSREYNLLATCGTDTHGPNVLHRV